MLSEPTLEDVLADRQKHMLCSDVDPAIRRRKELTKKDQARGARSLAGPASAVAAAAVARSQHLYYRLE